MIPSMMARKSRELSDVKPRLNSMGKVSRAPLRPDFHEEAINWTIPTMDIEETTESAEFHQKGIKFQCTFIINQPFKGRRGSIFNVKAHLNEDIKSIKFFFTMYCHQKDAKFRRIVRLSQTQKEGWKSKDFWLPLNHRNYDEISMDHYIEVIQIRYGNEEEKRVDYNADIQMSESVRFDCNVDELTLKKMRAKRTRWYFESDLFDPQNRNWCLRAFPRADYYDGKDLCKGLVVWPKIFFLPHNVKKMVVRCTTTNSVVDKTENHVFIVSQEGIELRRTTSLLNCIPYEKLMEITKLRISVEFQILRTYYEDGSKDKMDEEIKMKKKSVCGDEKGRFSIKKVVEDKLESMQNE